MKTIIKWDTEFDEVYNNKLNLPIKRYQRIKQFTSDQINRERRTMLIEIRELAEFLKVPEEDSDTISFNQGLDVLLFTIESKYAKNT